MLALFRFPLFSGQLTTVTTLVQFGPDHLLSALRLLRPAVAANAPACAIYSFSSYGG